MEQRARKTALFEKLQKEILDLQGFHVPLEHERINNGLGVINNAFPNHTFPVAAVHEFVSSNKEEAAATSAFISAILSSLMQTGKCLWVSAKRMIFPPALKAFNITPDQIIFADVSNNKDRLWVIEEALKCEALTAVVGEISELTFTDSRRLQLAVEKSHVTGFIHRNTVNTLNNVACVTRWHILPVSSSIENNLPGVGFPRWKIELQKVRNGRPGMWNVEWTDSGFKIITDPPKSIVIPIRKTG